MEQQVKLLPYGVADFATVIEQNLYYVQQESRMVGTCVSDKI